MRAVQAEGEWDKSLKLAKRTLEVAENFNEKDLPKQQEFFAALHSYIGAPNLPTLGHTCLMINVQYSR